MSSLREDNDSGKTDAGRELSKRDYAKLEWLKHRELYSYKGRLNRTICGIDISADQTVFTTRFDTKFVVNERDPRNNPVEALNFGSLEGWDEFACHLMAAECVGLFDVGANIGWYTCNLSKASPGLEKVIAVEPLGEARNYLQRNIELNGLENKIQVVAAACGEKAGMRSIIWDHDELGASSFYNLLERENARREEVEVITLDSLIDHIGSGQRWLLKIDVEGAEFSCVEGARRILSEKRPLIYVELLRKWASKAGYRVADLLSVLIELDYLGYCVKGGGLKPFDIDDSQIINTNFMFFPTECLQVAERISKKVCSPEWQGMFSYLLR